MRSIGRFHCACLAAALFLGIAASTLVATGQPETVPHLRAETSAPGSSEILHRNECGRNYGSNNCSATGDSCPWDC